jgi:hypothetical protein
VPIIGSSEYMMNFFRQEENAEFLLSFILDPTLNPPGTVWPEKFPSIEEDPPARDFRIYKLHCGFGFAENPTVVNAVNLRSFKTMKFLTNATNYKSISYLSTEYISIVCKINCNILLNYHYHHQK